MRAEKLDFKTNFRTLLKLKNGTNYITSFPKELCKYKVWIPIENYKDKVDLKMIDVKPGKSRDDKLIVYEEV